MKKIEEMTKAELIDAINRIKRIIYPCREIVDEYIDMKQRPQGNFFNHEKWP